MSNFYVDPNAVGTNDGSSWENAWTSLQTAFDTLTAGEECFCRGSQIISEPLSLSTHSGTASTGHIKFIGCNENGDVDGSKFVIDANSTAIYCLQQLNTANYIIIQNFELKNALSYNFYQNSPSSDYCIFYNCDFHSCAGSGTYPRRFRSNLYIFCRFYDNANSGANPSLENQNYLFCSFYDNGLDGAGGFSGGFTSTFIGCISYNNMRYGVSGFRGNAISMNSVIHNNGSNAINEQDVGQLIFIGNRITKHNNTGSYGFNIQGASIILGYNYFQGNAGGNFIGIPNTRVDLNSFGLLGIDANKYDLGDINYGYKSIVPESENFNLREDASLWGEEIVIPTK